jgi:hypothetical protein
MEYIVLLGHPLQHRRQEFRRIACCTEGDCADNKSTTRHQGIGAGIQK